MARPSHEAGALILSSGDLTLDLAKEVVDCCARHGVKTAIIGAVAVAVHGYPRGTEDLDLAAAADLRALQETAVDLRARGCVVMIGEPDFDDPLGGVVTVNRGDADPVQIVNYANPYQPGTGALADEAIQTAAARLDSLPVVDLAHLIALKLYAGGAKSKLDVVELLHRNAAADRDAIAEVCRRHGLGDEWDEVCRL
jgi:hypothetical protein